MPLKVYHQISQTASASQSNVDLFTVPELEKATFLKAFIQLYCLPGDEAQQQVHLSLQHVRDGRSPEDISTFGNASDSIERPSNVLWLFGAIHKASQRSYPIMHEVKTSRLLSEGDKMTLSVVASSVGAVNTIVHGYIVAFYKV